MVKTTSAPSATPSSVSGGTKSENQASGSRSAFLAMALNMSWQLAIVVLLPVVGGAELDKAQHSSPLWVLVGIGVALVLSGVVMRRTLQIANRLPVPKLSDEQKRAIQKRYEEEDAEA